MYSTCLFCNKSLGANQIIESLPIGRRVAFDQAKGRLWVVCRRCERWNLTPFVQRWEAIEDCERRFRDARKRVSSENIGLAKLDEGLELVRIGEPLRPEFAAWRYADQFGRRRRRAGVHLAAGVTVAGATVAGAWAVLGIVPPLWAFVYGLPMLKGLLDRQRTLHIPLRKGPPLVVPARYLNDIWLTPDHDSGWRLHIGHEGGTTTLENEEATFAAGLLMPRLNRGGASRSTVKRAVSTLEEARDPNLFLKRVAFRENYARRMESVTGGFFTRDQLEGMEEERNRPQDVASMRRYPTELRLAVEMAVNEESERIAMQGDLALLELAWKEAEEVAAIADRLLIPDEVNAKLERMRKHNSQGSV